MRKIISFVAVFAFSSAMALSAMAEAKDVKIEGEGQCAKCSLAIADKCENVLVVEKDGTKTNYFLVGDKSKAFHKNLCQGVKKTKVEGSLEKKDDKMVVTVTAIELVK
jgi:hypothetical protein